MRDWLKSCLPQREVASATTIKEQPIAGVMLSRNCLRGRCAAQRFPVVQDSRSACFAGFYLVAKWLHCCRLTTKRRQARLDCDSFMARQLDDRADEAKRKLDLLTRGCQAEFSNYRSQVGGAALQAAGALLGCQLAFFERHSEAYANRLVADDGSRTFQSFAAAALALCSMNEAQLEVGKIRTSASTNNVECRTAQPELLIQHPQSPRAENYPMPGAQVRNDQPSARRPPPPAPPNAASVDPFIKALPNLPNRDARKTAPPLPLRDIVLARHEYQAERPGHLSFVSYTAPPRRPAELIDV